VCIFATDSFADFIIGKMKKSYQFIRTVYSKHKPQFNKANSDSRSRRTSDKHLCLCATLVLPIFPLRFGPGSFGK